MELHATRIIVWDTPSSVACGAPFRLKVGVKCAAGCGATARLVEIRDAGGQRIGGAPVDDLPWRGTASLYHAELELRAPAAEGLHAWTAAVAEVPGRPGHAAAELRFQVRVVPSPECVLKVVAVDARSGAPVPGARVVVHPYRALTDENGVAEIGVPRGTYRLFVSGRDRFPFRSDGRVNADTTIRAELDLDLGPSDAELWS